MKVLPKTQEKLLNKVNAYGQVFLNTKAELKTAQALVKKGLAILEGGLTARVNTSITSGNWGKYETVVDATIKAI